MKYRVLKDLNLGSDAPMIGDEVQECHKPDYGMRLDHEHLTGKRHINISRDGDYPFFTVPVDCVEVVQ